MYFESRSSALPYTFFFLILIFHFKINYWDYTVIIKNKKIKLICQIFFKKKFIWTLKENHIWTLLLYYIAEKKQKWWSKLLACYKIYHFMFLLYIRNLILFVQFSMDHFFCRIQENSLFFIIIFGKNAINTHQVSPRFFF